MGLLVPSELLAELINALRARFICLSIEAEAVARWTITLHGFTLNMI